jgi:hypothetical protein
MSEFISTMPILILFLIAWFISFSAFLFIEKNEKRGYCLLIAALCSLMIIAHATVEVRCVDCSTPASVTTVSTDLGVLPILELSYFHMFMFVVELVLMFYYFTQYSLSLLDERKQ